MSEQAVYTSREGHNVYYHTLVQNKNPKEVAATRFLYNIPQGGGCFEKPSFVDESAFWLLVQEGIGDVSARKSRALETLGILEEQVAEIEPVFFRGFAILEGEVSAIKYDPVRILKSGMLVTPTVELTWIFFGDDQIYVSKCRIDLMTHANRSESTLEYHYKDVTAFRAESNGYSKQVPEYVETQGCFGPQGQWQWTNRTVSAETFRIVVPGDAFKCALDPSGDNGGKIAAMKMKLREKKAMQ